MKFGATCINNRVGGEELAKHVNKEIAVVTREAAKSELSGVFPEWEDGVYKGVKRKKRSMPRIIEDTRWAPSKRVKSPETAGPSTVSLALEDLNAPVEGCPIEDSMDDELLACVFMRLNMKDLSASMRTCKRWHRVACKEDVWEHIPLPANVPGALPRCVSSLPSLSIVLLVNLVLWSHVLSAKSLAHGLGGLGGITLNSGDGARQPLRLSDELAS